MTSQLGKVPSNTLRVTVRMLGVSKVYPALRSVAPQILHSGILQHHCWMDEETTGIHGEEALELPNEGCMIDHVAGSGLPSPTTNNVTNFRKISGWGHMSYPLMDGPRSFGSTSLDRTFSFSSEVFPWT